MDQNFGSVRRGFFTAIAQTGAANITSFPVFIVTRILLNATGSAADD